MKCDSFQEYLDGYLDGSLSELENEAMRAHMDSCGACKKIYEEQKQLLEALNDLDDGVHAPDDLVANAMARIHKERGASHKKSWWIAGGLAAALCLTLGLGTLLLGGGAKSAAPAAIGSAPNDSGIQDTASGYVDRSDFAYMEEAGAAADNGWADGTAADDMKMEAAAEEPAPEAAEAPSATQAPSAAEDSLMTQKSEEPSLEKTQAALKIIREANLTMETEQYDNDMQALRALVEENAGFITSNEEWGSGEYTRHMILNIRVPASSLDSFMERAKAIGSVISSAITETDVTDRYTDTDRRLKAYQKQYDRVLDMMDQAQTVDELIQIESELSRLELNIEDCQGALNYWDERIQYSSVTIYVDEVKRAAQEDQPLGLQMQNALEDSWETFTENAKETLVNTYAALPYIVTWLIVLVIVGGVVLIVVLTRRRKKRK